MPSRCLGREVERGLANQGVLTCTRHDFPLLCALSFLSPHLLSFVFSTRIISIGHVKLSSLRSFEEDDFPQILALKAT